MKEVDALDGICGLASDHSGVQYKMLNRSKGPAVWGPRAQIDRELYKDFVQNYLISTANLTIQTGSVENLLLSEDGNCKTVDGVVMKSGRKIKAGSVVITTGTFLRGQVAVLQNLFFPYLLMLRQNELSPILQIF
jgi:tRNA uridine 5-carboxymethylaminomethyl modification enzyme